MYYYIGEQSCRLGYRFVYNTKDKSCKYMSKEASWRLNIQKTLESKDVDINKLKVLGFKKVSSYRKNDIVLVFPLCSYQINGDSCGMSIHFFKIDKQESLTVEFDRSDIDFSLRGSSSFGIYGRSPLVLDIPIEMMQYLLHLYSIRDFDGIMQAFDNLFGVGLARYTTLRPETIILDKWG